ncbi:MAG: lysophospholipid acyltransferase family protein [Vulcanimicrobiota bacterium]
MKNFVLSILRWLLFSIVKPDIRGLEEIPAQGPVILAGNHPNVLDGLVVGLASPRPVRFLVAGELFRVPGLAAFLAWLGCIPVDRRQGRGNGDALRAAIEALEQGHVLALFPEGKTNGGRTLLEFKPGVALLGLRTGAPVIPLGLAGTEKAYPDGSFTIKPQGVGLVFGRPRRLENESVEQALQQVRGDILGCSHQAEALTAPGRCESVRAHLAVAASLVLTVSTRWAFH